VATQERIEVNYRNEEHLEQVEKFSLSITAKMETAAEILA